MDYIISFLLQVESFPNASLSASIDESHYINFSRKQDIAEAKQNASVFLDGMNQFYKEVNFDKYLFDSKIYYTRSIEELKKALPHKDFIGPMENFYKQNFDSYTLVPSLTIPKGMGFGNKYTADGKSKVFNVFGAFDHQKFLDTNELQMGFYQPQRLRELSVHEFGHSFVNHIVDLVPNELFLKTEKLFEPLKASMSKQGYNTWKVCLYEHFVRTGEIIISEKLSDSKGAKKLMSEYQEGRNFKYIPTILLELRNYSKRKHKGYSEAVLKSMEALAKQ